MPRKRRYNRRKRKRKSTSFGRKLLKDSRDARTSSAAEKAVKVIAKREAEKLIPKLLFRRYLFANYDADTNIMLEGSATRIDWNGEIVALAQIPLMDNATIPTYAMQNDPDIRPNPQVYNFGVNVIAPMRSFDGFRRGSAISIRKISLGLRFWTEQIGVGVPQLLDNVFVKYKVIAVQEDVAQQSQALSAPPADEVLPMNIFGYSSRLDRDIEEVSRPYKVRTLLSGGQLLNYSTTSRQTRQKQHFLSLKRPLRIEYASGDPATGAAPDQYGQRVTGPWKIYLVLRSSCPATYAALYKPLVGGFIKLSYTDT